MFFALLTISFKISLKENKVKRIYFAGFDVFSPKYRELTKKINVVCAVNNFIPLFPGNEERIPPPKEIFIGNRKMIQEADYVIANLNPFRGSEPDSGTVWETAYAYALQTPVVGYMSDTRCISQKVPEYFKLQSASSKLMPDGMLVEAFGYPVNLMLMQSITSIVNGDYETAIKQVASIDAGKV